MELKITTQQLLKVLTIVAWIIFIGLCVEAGGVIFNTIFALFINPDNAKNFWGIDLSNLYNYDMGHFLVVTLYMAITSVMKALMFYLIVRVSQEKNIDLMQPFNKKLVRLISNVAYLTIGIGIFSNMGVKYSEWLATKGIEMPTIDSLNLDGADVWLFMGVTLLVIAQIFKRGIEIQDEHELTV